MAIEEQLNDQLFELRKQGREGMLKLMGVDIDALRAFEKELIKKYSRIEKEIQLIYKKSGQEIAKRHKASHARAQRIIHRDIESILAVRQRYPDFEFNRYLCTCYYPFTADFESSGQTVTLSPSYGGNNSGSVTFDAGAHIAHPFASGQSPANGDWSGATVKAWFTFSFTPESDGTYCILPVVHLNGYWTLWSVSGCGSFESLPVFELVARVNVRVDQLSLTVRQIYHDVFTGPTYGRFASGFDYDSEVNQEIRMEAELEGGDQAVVFVECELLAGSNNLGRASIDMQTSPHFYFEVPMVRWGYPCNRLQPLNP